VYILHFAQLALLPLALAIVSIAILLRHFLRRRSTYLHPLGKTFLQHGLARSHPRNTIFFIARLATLVLLALMIAKPQIVDSRTKVEVEGIDIILVLDASNSMNIADYAQDNRSRFQVAKDEAIRFTEKREHDALGLVLFGNGAISRAPLTPDKQILRKLIAETQVGSFVDAYGTRLFTAIATAANRLKRSTAKSKIMILLTDGEPTEEEADPATVLELVKALGIKVYTVGIGSEEDDYIIHPFYGIQPKPRVNASLLQKIASDTGGAFFMAHDAHEMRRVYEIIDRLEKTTKEVPIFSTYYDIFEPAAIALLCAQAVELALATFTWFGI